jgi:hypothetical protein
MAKHYESGTFSTQGTNLIEKIILAPLSVAVFNE